MTREDVKLRTNQTKLNIEEKIQQDCIHLYFIFYFYLFCKIR